MTPIRRLDEAIPEVAFVVGVVSNNDCDDLAFIASYPRAAAFGCKQGQPNSGFVEIAASLDRANVIHRRGRAGDLKHDRQA
jgi:hypothetical protein